MERSKSTVKSRTYKARIAAGYVVLLIASHVTEKFQPLARPPAGVRFVTVHTIDHGVIEPRTIRLAYRDSAPASIQTPVLLVHGSPGSGEVLRRLADLLSPTFRVIVPDLPGFGSSTRDLRDYSFRAHGEYLVELMDALHVPKAQLVGFSMGGGVVLSIADAAPQRVASLVMLSAIGVQEHELTGSYRVNHTLHGAQLAVLWLLRNGLPHFGILSKVPFTLEYARNFYDSDQRPLRAVLEHYRGPMLIIQGAKDRNVPLAAAVEHHRLVPQSELVVLDENHFMAFMKPLVFLDSLVRFLNQVH